jgi:hypothetical protein
MKATTLVLTLTLAGCSSSCGGTTAPTVNWPRVVTCTEPAHSQLLEAVQRILVAPEDGETSTIGDRAIAALTDMATRHGEHVVACLVDEAVRSFENASRTDAAAMQAAPRAFADVPPEEPARKSVRTAPVPQGPEAPVQTVPEADADTTVKLNAAARGRDFLQRVAKTHVEADEAHGVTP